MASLSTLAMVAFIPALQLIGVSNVAVIIAPVRSSTAAIAWIWLRRKQRWRTFLGEPRRALPAS